MRWLETAENLLSLIMNRYSQENTLCPKKDGEKKLVEEDFEILE